MRFRPEQHLRRPGDIRAVRERGRRVECRAFTLWWKRRDPVPAPASASPSVEGVEAGGSTASSSLTPSAPPSLTAPVALPSPTARLAIARARPQPPVPAGARVCVIASTAAVGAATHRARAKRRLREIFRHQQAAVPDGCDLLLIARAAVTDWPMADLEKRFAEACRQIRPSAPPAP